MSGHSKWATIRRKKEKEDAKRGRIFTKLIKEISVAARLGGGDPEANPRLRTAIETARSFNMPHDNIVKAIQKGTGELPGVSYEETSYEGYGPGGVAILVEVMTDNKNRTVAEIRHVFAKHDGNLGASGCVAWMFDERGEIFIDASRYDEDTIIMEALEAGAVDVTTEEGFHHIITEPTQLQAISDHLKKKGIEIQERSLSKIPQSTVEVGEKEAEKVLGLMESLEDHDDVQAVYSNFDIPDEIMETVR